MGLSVKDNCINSNYNELIKIYLIRGGYVIKLINITKTTIVPDRLQWVNARLGICYRMHVK